MAYRRAGQEPSHGALRRDHSDTKLRGGCGAAFSAVGENRSPQFARRRPLEPRRIGPAEYNLPSLILDSGLCELYLSGPILLLRFLSATSLVRSDPSRHGEVTLGRHSSGLCTARGLATGRRRKTRQARMG